MTLAQNWHTEVLMRLADETKFGGKGCPTRYVSEVFGHHSIDFTGENYAKFSPDLSIKERFSGAGRTENEARMALAQNWHNGFFSKVADGCKLLIELVATGGIEPPTLGL